jgi:hypothetical protein
MADVHGSPADPGLQMPQATTAGPAPLPYAGPDLQPEPPDYDPAPLDMAPADGYVYHGVTNLGTTEDPSAYDVNGGTSGLVTPYYPGAIDPINAAGGVTDVAATVGESVANATGRWQALQAQTHKDGPVVGTAVVGGEGPQQQGSVIGDLMQFPPSALDPGAGVGNTLPTAGFYDPPREYGGAEGAPGYVGNEPPPGYQGEAQ